jgi:hypothetical protein
MRGVLTFKGGANKTARVSIDGLNDMTDVALFRGYVAPLSLAGVKKESLTQYNEINAAPDPNCSVENKAIFYFRDITDPSDVQSFRLELPAPDRDQVFEKREDRGYRVKKAIGEALATQLSSLTSRTIVFNYGTDHTKASSMSVK